MKSTCHHSPVKHYNNGYYCSVCLKQQWKTRRGTWMLYAGLGMLLLMASGSVKAPSINAVPGFSPPPVNVTYVCPETAQGMVPTDSSVLVELVKNNCVLPSVAVAQARIESANYTSDIAVHNKNLFGIKVHKCRYVTGERKGHATFASYEDNIACYCHIQKRYLDKIDKSYAEDPLYIEKVKRMR